MRPGYDTASGHWTFSGAEIKDKMLFKSRHVTDATPWLVAVCAPQGTTALIGPTWSPARPQAK